MPIMQSSTGRWVSGDDFFDRKSERSGGQRASAAITSPSRAVPCPAANKELLVNDSRNRSIRKFNPGTLQSDEEVIRQFVVRNHQLDAVLETLRDNIDSPSCQHVLVVAPRGRGKSMLLARVAAELRAEDGFSGSLLPVRFMEESQEVFNIADFWLETLFYLAREIEADHPGLSQELQETHADLAGRWSERATGDHARNAVLSAADRLGRKLVLMVENLQALCGDVDADFRMDAS